jgi:hypothetical protein
MRSDLFSLFNIILIVVFTLPILKILGVSPLDTWSWWLILAPFYMTPIVAGIVMIVQKILD